MATPAIAQKNNKSMDRWTVTQSNHLVEASYRLELIEKRVVLCLLSKIHPRKPLPEKIHLDANEYAEMTGTTIKNAYRDLKEGALGLVGKVIRTADIDKRMGRHQAWMDYVQYYDCEGRIEANFSASLKPYITQIAHSYTSIGIDHMAKFRSFYTIRLYEMALQYLKIGYRDLEVGEFREILQIGKKQYSRFTELRRRVIEPAINEINERSEYAVGWEKIGKGNRVTGIRLTVSNKQQLSLGL